MPYKDKDKIKEYHREYRRKNPEKSRAATAKYKKNNPDVEVNGHLLRKYGITLEEYNGLLEKQKGKCAICKTITSKRRLDVDHCHETGKIRGLLCLNCNAALGNFKDDPILLRTAIEYLKVGDAYV